MLNRWMLALGSDPATADLRQRARAISARSPDALVTAGPRRTFDELALADSLLGAAQAQSPTSALPSYERALLSERTGLVLAVAKQFFPDSAWLPDPIPVLQRGVGYADAAIKRAPDAADSWFARARLYHMLAILTSDPGWRDRALGDVRHSTGIVGGRADIWALQASLEESSGRWKEALYSVEQGEKSDVLHVYERNLLLVKWSVQRSLRKFDDALATCRKATREFPDVGDFAVCEPAVLGYSSRSGSDAERVLRLADSMSHDSAGPFGPFMPDVLRMFAVAILARGGLSDSAAHVYDRVIGGLSGNVVPAMLVNAAYARQVQGDLDSALALSARAVRLDSSLAGEVERDPGFEEMRRQPGYPDAIKGIPPSERRQ
jgi:tetratricopeptide (TPR) repeat protein